jgi:hypothetical protein
MFVGVFNIDRYESVVFVQMLCNENVNKRFTQWQFFGVDFGKMRRCGYKTITKVADRLRNSVFSVTFELITCVL